MPVFFQDWWLDAVCGNNGWQPWVYLDEKKDIIAIWPMQIKGKYGLRWQTIPPFTPILHPWSRKSFSELSDFLEAKSTMPSFGLYQLIQIEPQFGIEKTLISHGFEVQWRNTYVLDHTIGLEAIFSNFKGTNRTGIRKAGKQLIVKDLENIQDFIPLFEKHGREQKILSPRHTETLKRLFVAVQQARQGKILIAIDHEGNLHAGIFLVWDSKKCYCIITSREKKYAASRANSLLLWHAIQMAIEKGLDFDFEGGNIPSIGAFFASFGAEKMPYLRATRHPNQMIRHLVNYLKRL